MSQKPAEVLVTYNMGDGPDRKKYADLVRIIREHRPDVIAVQEVSDRGSILNRAADAFGYTLIQARPVGDGRAKVALLVRNRPGLTIKAHDYEHVASRTYVGPHGAGPSTIDHKYIVWVRYRVKGRLRARRVGCTHLVPSVQNKPFPGQAKRRRMFSQHIRGALDWFRGGRNRKALLGDFNATREFFMLDPLYDAGLICSSAPSHGKRDIDHCWLKDKQVQRVESEALRGYSSDHRPILFRVWWKW